MTKKKHNVRVICKDLLEYYSDNKSMLLGLETAEVLSDLSMSKSVIRCGFINNLRHQEEDINTKIIAQLSTEEKSLFNDLKKISIIDTLDLGDDSKKIKEKQKENDSEKLRQLLLAMADDIRVVVIKLAIRLVCMRHLSSFSKQKRQILIKQTRDIQAPLANRLGIAKLKWELEDLVFKEVDPKNYKLIAESFHEQRKDREHFVEYIVKMLKKAIEAEKIKDIKVYGRAKHISSIFNKMKKKNKNLEDIYDLIAIRVQVNSLKDCYTSLGIVHTIWRHIPSEFDDYIANPKPNGYQSLHTAVVGPNDKTIEIQIRTNEMHDYAELGVAAHWRYKENSTGKVTAFARQINWLRALINESNETITDEFKEEIKEDRVYAITPKGKVIDLPAESTVLDFAYYIHTDIGHRTTGARINGNLVPLTHTINTGDTIEVLTNKNKMPSRDWLNPHYNYLKSSKSKAKVRHFFKQFGRDKAIEEGKELLEKSLKKLGIKLNKKYIEKTNKKFNFKNSKNLYASIGFGDIGLFSITNYIDEIRDDKHEDLDNISKRISRIPIKAITKSRNNIIIEEIDDLLISMASCCSPVPPEDITGYITKTKGVRIHLSSCHNLIAMKESEPEKIMSVTWSKKHSRISAVILIQASDRIGLIRDIVQAISNEGVSIQKANLTKDNEQNINLQMQINVRDSQHIEHVTSKINNIKNVKLAIRIISES